MPNGKYTDFDLHSINTPRNVLKTLFASAGTSL